MFEILPLEYTDKPNILYKLYPLTEYSINGLLNQYIYATHPSQFNDIFDCNEELLEFDDDNVIKTFLKNSIDEYTIDNLLRNYRNAISDFARIHMREIIYRKWGVFSMTGNPNNILMWSYYTNNMGLCIEFDVSKFPFKFQGPFPVNYQSQLYPISIKEVGIQLGVLLQSNLKIKGWEHESEWRFSRESFWTRYVFTQFSNSKKAWWSQQKIRLSN